LETKKGEDGELHLPKQNHYYAQAQGELAVINKEWCDFVVYSNGVHPISTFPSVSTFVVQVRYR